MNDRPTVLQATQTLLSVCDGARTLDGQGFNKFDSLFVRDIVSRGRDLTERQELAIHKILRKYTKQLANHGIDYGQIQLVAPPSVPVKESKPMHPVTAGLEVATLEPMALTYLDNPRLPLFKLYSHFSFRIQAKSLPTAYWHPEDKTWTYSPTVGFFTAIQPFLIDGTIKPDQKAMLRLADLGRIQKQREKVQTIKNNSKVTQDKAMPTKMKPFTHQIKAFQIGTTVEQSALLMEQGTGKTLSAISIAGYRYLRGEIQRLLIVAPLSVTSVWKEEFEKVATFKYRLQMLTKIKNDERIKILFLNEPKDSGLQVIIINYESTWRFLEPLLKWNPQMIIADESQKIKNGRTKQSKALHKLGDQTTYKLILTGTPITQGPLDIWSQYRFLNPTIFGKGFLKFRDKYAIMGGYGGYEIKGYQNLSELADKAHSIAYRVTKEEALDLPDQMDQIIRVELEPEVKKLYDQMEKDFIIQFSENETVSAPIVLTQLLRLQQITGGFVPIEENQKLKALSTAKLNAVRELLEDLSHTKKIVIFARFSAEIEALENLAKECHRGCVTLTGKTKKRAEVRNAFQTNPEITILIAQIQTGGLGITLTASDTVIFYSTTFGFGDYDQAKARVHRIGQTHSVTYIHILADQTVDEDILEILRIKGDMATLIVDRLSRKFFSKGGVKPFTSIPDRDRIKLNSEKEVQKNMADTDETKDPKKEGLREKLAKIKAASEKATPESKKVDKKPEVEKNKVKKSKADRRKEKKVKREKREKGEKKVTKSQDPNLVLLKDLATELKVDPKTIRKVLRKEFNRPEGSAWAWKKNDPELAKIRKLFKDKK